MRADYTRAGRLTEKRVVHYIVECARCRHDQRLCPRREEHDRTWAVTCFERAGWHLDANRAHVGGLKSDHELGHGTWYCPNCRGQLR